MEEQRLENQFYAALLQLKTPQECQAFFRDVATVKELQALCQRLEVARLLRIGKNYQEISTHTGASSATISRVNKCLVCGSGYATALERMKEEA